LGRATTQYLPVDDDPVAILERIAGAAGNWPFSTMADGSRLERKARPQWDQGF